MNAIRAKPERTTVKLKLSLQKAVNSPGLPHRGTVRRWLAAALTQDAAITVRFVGTAEARTLNHTYRGRDYATNVLCFGYGSAAHARALAGDIVLCAPLARREARAQGKTLIAHCTHLTVHAALHLQGYDHQRPRAAARMEALEKRILASLGVANPYAQADGTRLKS